MRIESSSVLTVMLVPQCGQGNALVSMGSRIICNNPTLDVTSESFRDVFTEFVYLGEVVLLVRCPLDNEYLATLIALKRYGYRSHCDLSLCHIAEHEPSPNGNQDSPEVTVLW